MWKKIKNLNNYSVNENGEVRNDISGKIKSAYVCKANGYYYVDLWENNKCKKMQIHRIIAEAFIPNPENKPTVDHADGNRRNNRIDNLRWATYSEQNSRFNTYGVRSEKIYAEKENGEKICFNQISEAAKYFGCTIGNISQMLKKGTFGVRGKTRYYRFRYEKV